MKQAQKLLTWAKGAKVSRGKLFLCFKVQTSNNVKYYLAVLDFWITKIFLILQQIV